jgi:hypothetical protein
MTCLTGRGNKRGCAVRYTLAYLHIFNAIVEIYRERVSSLA